MDDGLFDIAFKTVGSIAMGAIAYIGNQSIKRIDKIEQSQSHCKEDLLEHKIECEKTYAKELTMQTALGRVHDRIDEIGKDIKTLLARK